MNDNLLINNRYPTLNGRAATAKTLAGLSFTLLALAIGQANPPQTGPTTGASGLLPGDIVYADSGDGIRGGALVAVSPGTGTTRIVSEGGWLQMPYDVVVDAAGQVVVSDSGRLLRVDAATGQQTIMAHNGDGRLGMPYGLTLAHDGAVIVANGRAIVRVNPRTGELQEVTSGGYLTAALDVAEGLNGDLFVVNVAWPESQIIRVNGRTGRQTVLTQGQFLNAPSCIVAQGQDLFVTDLATSDRNFGAGRVVQVNAANGHQEVITQGLPLLGPVGIAVDLDGHLVVSDPYLINPETTNYDGGILRLDRRSGELAILAQGSGSFVNPRGVAVMPRGMNARR